MKFRNVFLTTILATAAITLSAMSPAQSVNQRLHNQNNRVKQGVKDGQLTRNQVDRLRSSDARIRSQELRDKSKDNGKLTNGQRKQLNRELNRNSKRIYRDRHDAASHGG